MDIKVEKLTYFGKNHYQVFVDGIKFPYVNNKVKLLSKRYYIPEDTFKSHYNCMFKNEEEVKSYVVTLAKQSYESMKKYGWF